jgi:hypothetical protein
MNTKLLAGVTLVCVYLLTGSVSRGGPEPPVASEPPIPTHRNAEGVLDTIERHTKSDEYTTIVERRDIDRPVRVLDRQGRDVRRIIYNKLGRIVECVLPNGSYVADGPSHWRFRDLDGNFYLGRMTDLTVDRNGNLSFDNDSIGARVSVTPDDYVIICYWHRGDWGQRHEWALVRRTKQGWVQDLTDVTGKSLRRFH